jgi:hypothetical protein
MPLPAETSLCIIGDSHLACIRQALNEDRVDVGAVHLEFWGADGPRFRDIHLIEGRLQPLSAEARERVEWINGNGRASVGAGDFTALLFAGCRLRAHEYLVPILWRLGDEAGFLSQAVRRMVLHRWLNGTRSYRTAKEFAADGSTRVFFSPAPFLNDQVLSEADIARNINQQATAEQRAMLWDEVEQMMAVDGVELLRQPEQTVTRGCLSKIEFAPSNAVFSRDTVHKNGAYGALVLGRTLERMAQTPRATAVT